MPPLSPSARNRRVRENARRRKLRNQRFNEANKPAPQIPPSQRVSPTAPPRFFVGGQDGGQEVNRSQFEDVKAVTSGASPGQSLDPGSVEALARTNPALTGGGTTQPTIGGQTLNPVQLTRKQLQDERILGEISRLEGQEPRIITPPAQAPVLTAAEQADQEAARTERDLFARTLDPLGGVADFSQSVADTQTGFSALDEFNRFSNETVQSARAVLKNVFRFGAKQRVGGFGVGATRERELNAQITAVNAMKKKNEEAMKLTLESLKAGIINPAKARQNLQVYHQQIIDAENELRFISDNDPFAFTAPELEPQLLEFQTYRDLSYPLTLEEFEVSKQEYYREKALDSLGFPAQ
ncbi:MAG: hypothetical protein HC874_27315 [Richelia sp. SL_2_1]|nr:hypothetical protein [Richelia sp. SL_2_1]